mmetsp:Transcript_126240/g.404072  ORF Transcript_126240/g.404072 Transcript_126240/m.404072 type:complete len:228 (+) Transcript_126240:489-1172(+)
MLLSPSPAPSPAPPVAREASSGSAAASRAGTGAASSSSPSAGARAAVAASVSASAVASAEKLPEKGLKREPKAALHEVGDEAATSSPSGANTSAATPSAAESQPPSLRGAGSGTSSQSLSSSSCVAVPTALSLRGFSPARCNASGKLKAVSVHTSCSSSRYFKTKTRNPKLCFTKLSMASSSTSLLFEKGIVRTEPPWEISTLTAMAVRARLACSQCPHCVTKVDKP